MPGFLHFLPYMTAERLVPAGRAADPAVLEARGLGTVLADARGVPDPLVVTATLKGPGSSDGHAVPGVVLYPKPPSLQVPSHVGYAPDFQRWLPVGELPERPGCPQRWIGWLADAPPEPEDLERSSRVPGYTVTVGHPGRGYHVPIARARDGRSGTLPADWRFEGGKPVKRIKAQYAALWSLAGKAWDFFNGPAETRAAISDEELVLLAVRALQVNYRVGPDELDVLAELGQGVLDTDSVISFLLALIDNQFLALAAAAFAEEEGQKKTSPDASSNGTAGGEGTPPAAG